MPETVLSTPVVTKPEFTWITPVLCVGDLVARNGARAEC